MRFIAAINTRIYGRSYAQGAEIDISAWSRKQMLQFLNLGLIQANQITTGMITDAIVFQGAGVTTTTNPQGQLVVIIEEVPHPLDWLEDVSTEGAAGGQLLGFDELDATWKPMTVSLDGSQITFASLADVDTSAAEDGWTMAYHALTGTWVAVASSSGTLAGLQDVDVTGIVDGETVIWDNSAEQFVPGSPTGLPGPAGPVAWATPVPWGTGFVATIGPPASVVTYLGSSYVALTSHTNILPTNTTAWRLIVSKGDKGDRGDVGPASTVPGPPGQGVPTGGTTGQVLTKTSATNYATNWATPGAGYTDEQVRDVMGTALVAGPNVTITPSDVGDTITIASTGGGAGLDLEAVQDAVDAMIVAGTNVTKTYDDTAGTLTINSTATGGGGATARVPYVFTDGRDPLTAGPGTLKLPNTTGRTLTLLPVRVDLVTAPTGGPLTVDVHKNGTTIFTTQSKRPSVAAAALFDVSDVPDVTSWADGETLTVDIDLIGTTVAGGGATITIIAEG